MDRIINIVDNLSKINFGIWNAAITTASHLSSNYAIQSELWYPEIEENNESVDFLKVPLSSLTMNALNQMIKSKNLNPCKDIIVSHGSWRFPTRWGAYLSQLGFKWVYVPQGMLEPWSISQKRLKKKIYFELKEKKLVNRYASGIRAVSQTEFDNLRKLFPNKRIVKIPNGVSPNLTAPIKTFDYPLQFLFLSRLHHKKGIFHLVQAWINSTCNNNPNFTLTIAGPDQGELSKIEVLLKSSTNAQYIGPQYGENKESLLNQSHFYVLPSYSEGFPTAVLEGTSYGLIPMITEGCNFPELFEQQLATSIQPDTHDIMRQLNFIAAQRLEHWGNLSSNVREFTNKHYSLGAIAKQQVELYRQLTT